MAGPQSHELPTDCPSEKGSPFSETSPGAAAGDVFVFYVARCRDSRSRESRNRLFFKAASPLKASVILGVCAGSLSLKMPIGGFGSLCGPRMWWDRPLWL